MLFRPFLNHAGSCASYLFGCTTYAQLAVVDPHVDLVDDYLSAAAAAESPITAVFETHVHADHVSGLPSLVAQTGATAYLPAGADVVFDHVALEDGVAVDRGSRGCGVGAKTHPSSDRHGGRWTSYAAKRPAMTAPRTKPKSRQKR